MKSAYYVHKTLLRESLGFWELFAPSSQTVTEYYTGELDKACQDIKVMDYSVEIPRALIVGKAFVLDKKVIGTKSMTIRRTEVLAIIKKFTLPFL